MMNIFKSKNNKKDDGHVIFVDKLTDHHIQKDINKIKKESKGNRIINKTVNK